MDLEAIMKEFNIRDTSESNIVIDIHNKANWFNSGGVYKTYKDGKATKEYISWEALKMRLTSGEEDHAYRRNNRNGRIGLKNNSAWRNCTVDIRWLDFQVFAEWYCNNIYEMDIAWAKLQIDKDIKIKGNLLYSTETCLIVPGRINSYFVNTKNVKGYTEIDGRYVVTCSLYETFDTRRVSSTYITGIRTDNEQEAHENYLEIKNRQLQEVVIPDFIKHVKQEYRNHPMVLDVVESLTKYRIT